MTAQVTIAPRALSPVMTGPAGVSIAASAFLPGEIGRSRSATSAGTRKFRSRRAQWHYVSVVYSESNITFYCDGDAVSYGSPGTFGPYSSTMTLGFDDCGGCAQWLNGKIEETTVFGAALSVEQEATLYNNGAGVYGSAGIPNLIAGYDFDEGQGKIVHDFSGNGYTGTLLPGTLWTSGKPLGNTASLTTSDLPFGNDSIIATYSGDSNYRPAVSAPLLETVVAPTLYWYPQGDSDLENRSYWSTNVPNWNSKPDGTGTQEGWVPDDQADISVSSTTTITITDPQIEATAIDFRTDGITLAAADPSDALALGPNGTTIVVDAGTATVTATIVDESGVTAPAGLTTSGGGMLKLQGQDSFSGGTTIVSGTLQVGNALALGSGTLTINGGTLDLNGNNVHQVASLAGNGGAITNSVPGSTSTLAVDQGANTEYSGNIQDGAGIVGLTLSGGGVLTLGGANRLGGPIVVSPGSTLSVAAGGNVCDLGLLTNDGTITDAGTIDDDYILVNADSGSMYITSTGSLTVGNATLTNWGYLENDGTLTNSGVGEITNVGWINNKGSAIFSSGYGVTTSGTITDWGSLELNEIGWRGTCVLNNIYAGSITVEPEGLFSVVSGAVVNDENTATITIASSAEMYVAGTLSVDSSAVLADNGNLVFSVSGGQTFAGNIGGTGSVSVAGTGILTLSGNNTYTGGTEIDGGELSLGSGGALGAGRPDQLCRRHAASDSRQHDGLFRPLQPGARTGVQSRHQQPVADSRHGDSPASVAV